MRNVTTLYGAIKSSPFIKSRFPLQLQPTTVDHAQRRAIRQQMRGHQSSLDANDVKNVQGWIFPGWIIASVGHSGRWTSFYTLFRNTFRSLSLRIIRWRVVRHLQPISIQCKYSYITFSLVSWPSRHLWRSYRCLNFDSQHFSILRFADSWRSKQCFVKFGCLTDKVSRSYNNKVRHCIRRDTSSSCSMYRDKYLGRPSLYTYMKLVWNSFRGAIKQSHQLSCLVITDGFRCHFDSHTTRLDGALDGMSEIDCRAYRRKPADITAKG